MTAVTLRPTSTIADNLVTLVGGATAHAVLADDSDSSYVQVAAGGFVLVGIDNVSLPAGAVTKTVTLRWRASTTATSATAEALLQTDLGSVSYGSMSLTGTITAAALPAKAWNASQASVDALVAWARFPSATMRVAEMYVDLVYATRPTVTVTGPTGVITDTTTPTIEFTYAAGDDGGAQTSLQVKVFTDDQHAAAGWNVDTSTAVYDSGQLFTDATSHTVPALATGVDYWVFVRAAQTINGNTHWSVWDDAEFTVSTPVPVIASVTATPDSPAGRVELGVVLDDGSAAWDAIEIERSHDGGSTWIPIRGGSIARVPTSVTAVTLYDFEADNGRTVIYRARPHGDGLIGGWVVSGPTAWSSQTAWLKDLTDSSLNRPVRLRALPEPTRPIRQTVHEVLGSAHPVVVSDVRGSERGQFTIQTGTEAEAAAVTRLLERPVVLLQLPPGWDVPSRYVALGDWSRERAHDRVGGAAGRIRRFTVSYVQVARPQTGSTFTTTLTTWDDLRALDVTWDDVALSGLTWAQLLVESGDQLAGLFP